MGIFALGLFIGFIIGVGVVLFITQNVGPRF